MQKVNNKGFSMVEILIAITIFAILMGPIVSGIISSLKNTSNAKDLQYRNECAENMVEYVKQDSLENILLGNYFSTLGVYDYNVSAKIAKDGNMPTYDSSLRKYVDAVALKGTFDATNDIVVSGYDNGGIGSNKVYYPYEEYMLSGKVKLGAKDTVYSYKMQISNEYYAEKQENGSYVNPNNLALGVVEDIDYTKVALINGTIANYDEAVSNAFLSKKIEVLKDVDPVNYEVYVGQTQLDEGFFRDDTATRFITVKVSGKADQGYKVTCNLKYYDSCASNSAIYNVLKDYAIEYTPFEYNYPVDSSTGVAKLPSIYLMYNNCLYNGRFSKDDYIILDTSNLQDDAPVDFFIVQTAEQFSTNLSTANSDLESSNVSVNKPYLSDDDGDGKYELYNNSYSAGGTRSGVNVHLAATVGSNLANVSVYHNFDDAGNLDVNKKCHSILYKSSDDPTSFYPVAERHFTNSDYLPLVNYTGGAINFTNSVLRVASLDQAQQESRGLYQIKLWMVETDDLNKVDTSVSPTMTATKGGNES